MKNIKKVSFQNKKITPVFTDARGSIFDVLEEKIGHIGIITFSKGATRANHYHKKSVQYSYILEGKIRLTVSDVDGSNRKVTMLTPGMMTTIPAKTIHTYTALVKSKIIDMTTLGRNDNGYEKDTVRV